MSLLNEILSPLPVEEFYKSYWHHYPYAVPHKANLFRNLIGWEILDEIISSGHPDCWLPQRGALPRETHLSSGSLDFKTARAEFLKGRTILVRHAELANSKIKNIAEQFQKIFKAKIDVQLYSTPGGEEGFDWHYDIEEVFVFQSQGIKEFRLRKNTVMPRSMLKDLKDRIDFREEKSPYEIHCCLNPGDWLYIPAGFWHKAKAHTESHHLSVGVMAL
jgi:50S ribosomal protein L16 3-hydroxylase